MKIGNILRGAIRIGNTWRVNLVLTAAISLGVFFSFSMFEGFITGLVVVIRQIVYSLPIVVADFISLFVIGTWFRLPCKLRSDRTDPTSWRGTTLLHYYQGQCSRLLVPTPH